MKMFSRRTVLASSFMVLIGSHQAPMFAGAGLSGIVGKFFAQNAATVIVDGATFSETFFVGVLNSLEQYAQANPNAFSGFVADCLQATNSAIPNEFLAFLQKYDLVSGTMTLGEAINFIVTWVVEQKADGTLNIWSFADLVSGGYITVK